MPNGGVNVSNFLWALWYSGFIRSNPSTLNQAHIYPGVAVEALCGVYYTNGTLSSTLVDPLWMAMVLDK